MSLVEVLVSIGLLAGVSLPLAHVANTALAAANGNGNRQDAAELALGVLAKLEAIPYGQVGFTAATLASTVSFAPGYATASGSPVSYSWLGRTLVELPAGASDPAFALGSDAVPFAPVMQGVITGGGSFAVTTHLSQQTAYVPSCPGWASPTTALADAYVAAYVTVSWKNADVPSSLSVSSVVYPGGLGGYRGPSYVASDVPGTPTDVTASPAVSTGEVKVSWTVPATWTSSQCFAVGWADSSGEGASTGLLADASLGDLAAGSTASFTLRGLTQGAEYVAYVTSYAGDGVESAESADSATVQSPTGPLVSQVSTTPGGAPAPDAYGPPSGGATVTITGSGFSTVKNGTRVFFGTTAATSVTCSSTTICTAIAPAGSGTPDVTAATATGPGGSWISSPTLVGDQFSYDPTVTGVSPSKGPQSGGTAVTLTGANFVVGSTQLSFGSGGNVVSATCTSTTSCTATTPAEGATVSSPVDVIATTPGGTSSMIPADQYSYLGS